MAGYLITLNSLDSLEECIMSGTYSTVLSPPRNGLWNTHHEGTFADYLSMKKGDWIFFFIKRKIYGCGRLVDVGEDCKYTNYRDALLSSCPVDERYSQEHLLEYGSTSNRCFCTFVPEPAFFRRGVDMDEVLQNTSSPFHSVRALWKLSFIKMDDEESDVLASIIIKNNESVLHEDEARFPFDDSFHQYLRQKDLSDFRLDSRDIVASCLSHNGNTLRHEMAIEAALCERLSNCDEPPFGRWDYISHQVPASPFKPIDYMDKVTVQSTRELT